MNQWKLQNIYLIQRIKGKNNRFERMEKVFFLQILPPVQLAPPGLDIITVQTMFRGLSEHNLLPIEVP